MKKIFTALFSIIIVFSVLAPTVDASKYNLSKKNVTLPNLLNPKTANFIKHGKFSFYNIKPGDSEKKLKQYWGNGRGGWSIANDINGTKSIFYGKKDNVLVNITTIKNMKNRKYKGIQSLTLIQPNKYEFYKLKKVYKFNKKFDSLPKSGAQYIRLNERNYSMYFMKKGSKYYLNAVTVY